MTPQQKEERELRKKVRAAKRTPSQHRAALRRKVKYFYDLQRLRMQTAGRHKVKEGGAHEVELNEIDLHLLEKRSEILLEAEKIALKDVEDHLKTDKFYMEYLRHIKGIGPTMAGVILAEVDITRCNTPSALWKYAGLAPVPVRRCKKCNQVVKEITTEGGRSERYEHTWKTLPKGCEKSILEHNTYASARAMRPTKGEKLPYNAFLKTKLVGVLGGILIKCNAPHRKFYDDYKHRWQSAGKGTSDAHRHAAAIRYMVKMLLLEIWTEWRAMEGLPGRVPYQEEYLGHRHSA